MQSGNLPLLVCLFFTLYNTGVVWFLQLNHYPLYKAIGEREFQSYLAAHNRRIPLPIVLPSLAAFAASLLLLLRHPFAAPDSSVWLVVILNALILLSTIFVQGKAHAELARAGYSRVLVDRIIATNWIRVAAWTINALRLIWMTAGALDAAQI